MRSLASLFRSRELDDWRDDEILIAAKVLNQVACDLITSFEAELKAASWRDGLVSPSVFIHDKVAPKVRAVAEPVVENIVIRANAKLAELGAYQAVWSRSPGQVTFSEGDRGAIADLAAAAAPLAGGAAVAAALPALAVTTTGGLLGTGLFATTVVAWPVVAVGGAAVGVAWATGALNASKIWSKAENRLRNKISEYVTSTLIRGPKGSPALLEQLSKLFTEAATEAKRRS